MNKNIYLRKQLASQFHYSVGHGHVVGGISLFAHVPRALLRTLTEDSYCSRRDLQNTMGSSEFPIYLAFHHHLIKRTVKLYMFTQR